MPTNISPFATAPLHGADPERPWFVPGKIGVPPLINQQQAEQTCQQVYSEAATFGLATCVSPRDIDDARAKAMRFTPTRVRAMVEGAKAHPKFFSPQVSAMLENCLVSDQALENMRGAHERIMIYYGNTRALRRANAVDVIEVEYQRISGLVEQSVASGKPDPELLALFEPLRVEWLVKKEQAAETRQKTENAFARGQEEARATAASLEDEVRALRAQNERLLMELQQLRQPSPPPPTTEPGRRQHSR